MNKLKKRRQSKELLSCIFISNQKCSIFVLLLLYLLYKRVNFATIFNTLSYYLRMEIYFIRHTSVAVPKGTCYGITDVELSDTFEQEASCTKKYLEGIVFDKAYTSPLTRAVRLASFCGFPDAERDARLAEFDFGEWEMKNYDDLYQNDPRFVEWSNNYLSVYAPGGESIMDQYHRVQSFIESVKTMNYNRIVAFCHGGILALTRVVAGEVPLEQAFSNVPPYGSIIKIVV